MPSSRLRSTPGSTMRPTSGMLHGAGRWHGFSEARSVSGRDVSTSGPVFDPTAPGFSDDPYGQYAALRGSDPIHESALGFWFLTRYADVVRRLREPRMSVDDARVAAVLGSDWPDTNGMALGGGARSMLNVDPPAHTRLRGLVSKAFTPHAVATMRRRIGCLVDRHLETFERGATIDVVGEFAVPISFTVICDVLGVPPTGRDEVRLWSNELLKTLDPIVPASALPAIGRAAHDMRAFVNDVIDAKRSDPSNDLLRYL